MTGTSAIEWTEQTWNPIVGCSLKSPGCVHCYAMPMAARIEAINAALVADGKPPQSPQYDGTTKKVNGHAVWTGKLAMAGDNTLLAPLKRKKPTTYFVNSMGDLFHEDCPDEWIDRVFAVMALCPQHTFQVLTKRAARMRDYCTGTLTPTRLVAAALKLPRGDVFSATWPLPNVWLGVSTERQQEADERIPELLRTPAAVRFISYEPALGALNLKRWMPSGKWGTFNGAPVYHQKYFMTKCEHCGWFGSSELCHECSYGDDADVVCPSCNKIFLCDEVDAKLHWVICGGESGPSARPMHPDWARGLRDQCAAAGVDFFFKQWGNWMPDPQAGCAVQGSTVAWPDGTIGGGMAHDRGGLGTHMFNVGKARAGKLLDGVMHQALPRTGNPGP